MIRMIPLFVFFRLVKPIFLTLFFIFAAGVSAARAEDMVKTDLTGGKGLPLMEAVRDTLVMQPNVLIQQQDVLTSEGQLQVEAGVFDANLNSSFVYTRYGTAVDQYQAETLESTNRTYLTTEGTLGIQKQTRYGITFGPSVNVTRSHGVTDYLVNSSSNQSTVNFGVTVPLLKGLGRDATGAEEMAAEAQLEASRLQLENTVSQSVMETTIAYWSYLEAQMQLEIMRQMEKDSRKGLEDTTLLVKGDQQPASDLDTLKADLAEKISGRISTEQSLFVARQNLGLAMGIADEAIDSLPLPADPFPDSIHGLTPMIHLDPKRLFKEALVKRGDYLAAKKQEKASKILLTAAINNLLPQLDIKAGVGYTGLQDGGEVNDFFRSLGHNMDGANYSTGITLTIPLGNTGAKGLLVQRRSSLRKVVINTRNLERNIRSGIVVAIQGIRNAIRELTEMRRSVKFYKTAVSNQQTLFSMGMSSILDVINMQNFLQNASLDEVGKRNNYAAALVNLNYQTGNLVVAAGDNYQVAEERLTSLPTTRGKIDGGK